MDDNSDGFRLSPVPCSGQLAGALLARRDPSRWCTSCEQARRSERTQLRAFTLDSFESSPGYREDLPIPSASDDELLVQVHASSVNPADAAVASGMLKGMAEYEFPITLGRDFAGVVETVGSAVSRFETGDAVFGFVPHANPTVRDGSWADYLVIPQDSVARKPASVDFATVGVAPVAALTALAALDALELSSDDSVFVLGAAGGVGSFFVQLAAARGVQVIAPALPEDGEYLRNLGASEILERDSDLVAHVRNRFPEGVDALLDLVSSTPDESLLKEGGRLASPLGAAGEGPGRANVMASGTTANLERLAQVLDAGTLRVHIQDTYPLEQAGRALQTLASTHIQGKLAIAIA